MNKDLRNTKLNRLYEFQYGKGNTIENIGGNYPIYGSNGPVGYTNKYNSIDAPVIGHIGANAGIVNWGRGRHYVTYNGVICKIKTDINPKFGYYTLLVSNLQKRLRGSTQPFVSYDLLNEVEVYLPDRKTQDKIAKVLSDLDDKVYVNNKINLELEALAKTLYEYWFVQFDFPNEKGKPYKSSGGKMKYSKILKRNIPVDWDGGYAKDIIKFNPTLSLKKGALQAYIDMNSLPTSGFMTDEPQSKEYRGGIKFENGDVLIARITPCLENGKTALVTQLPEGQVGFGSTEFIVLRGLKQSLSSYAACFARSEYFRKYAITNMTGTSGRKRIDYKNLEITPIPIPEKEILSKFEKLVNPFFKKMNENSKENQKLSELRDWLLPMLMNGQVTVGEAEEELRMVAEQGAKYGKE